MSFRYETLSSNSWVDQTNTEFNKIDIDKSNQLNELKPKHTVLAQFLDCVLFRKKVWGAYTCSKVECSFCWSFSSSYVSLCFRFWFLYFCAHVSCMCEFLHVARFVNINSIELGELKLMSPFRVENGNISEKVSGVTCLVLFPQVF